MRALLSIFLALLGCGLVHGRTKDLTDGSSPDGRFRVRISENARKRITYDLIATRTGAVLHRLPGSFQPAEDDPPNWSWNRTDARVYWSHDSRYVAIDEEVYRYGGTVLLAEIRRGTVRPIRLPAALIAAQISSKWERYRYRIKVDRGWLSAHDLSLEISGLVITGALPDGDYISENRTFEMIVRLGPGRAIPTRWRDITNEPLEMFHR